MTVPSSWPWSYRAVSILRTECVWFVAEHDASSKEDLKATAAFKLKEGEWTARPETLDLTGVCTFQKPGPTVLFMDVDGAVVRGAAVGFTREDIDAGPEGPDNVGDLQEIRAIGKRAYVVGMRRMVYRSDGPGSWTRVDQGVRCGPDDKSDAGFMSIHGFDESDIYAGGWEGEIWSYDGKKWKQHDTPTNLAFFRVVCAPDGNVYAAGQRGLLVRGRGSKWKVIEHDATKEDFYGATWFQDRLYLATLNGIFRLEDGDVVPVEIVSETKVKFAKHRSFYRLDANDEILWSAGFKMLLSTRDGTTWSEPAYE